MDYTKLQNDINKFWDDEIVPTLTDYIKIPNKSPAFDPQWKENGHMDKVLHLAKEWVEKYRPENSTLHIKEVENRTPIMHYRSSVFNLFYVKSTVFRSIFFNPFLCKMQDFVHVPVFFPLWIKSRGLIWNFNVICQSRDNLVIPKLVYIVLKFCVIHGA